MDDVLICSEVTKRRDGIAVVDGVSLAMPAGLRVALLGHNGAGKSTLIKMILGLTSMDEGEISIAGTRPGSDAARRQIAYLPEAVAFQPALTGRELMKMFARLSDRADKDIATHLDRVGLSHAADRRISTYSKGMRQRLGLAQVLLGKPRLALLDEPASGLDPVSRHELYAIIDELAASGTTVLVASHALTEVEARTDRIAILKEGRLVAHDTLANLSRGAGLPITLHVRANEMQVADRIASQTGGTRVNGTSVEIHCASEDKMAALHRLSDLGPEVVDINITPPGLEDLYRFYSRGSS